ncbi:sensor histidine kinase [Sulfurimonas sp.]
MRKVEFESFIKSFLLFFISQAVLVGALFFINYQREVQSLDDSIFSQMRVCSYTLSCDKFQIDFVPTKEYEPYKLYKSDNELSAYFSIPNSTKNYLKLYLPKEKYINDISKLKHKNILVYLIILLIISILSSLFSLYTLAPLRNALLLTEEFIKDILHDFNTPLSTLRLNVSMLKEEAPQSTKLKRIENSVQNILNLQANLRAYLQNHVAQKGECDLSELISQRVEQLSNIQNIKFSVDIPKITLACNSDAFVRILDNLLSNAVKYNKVDGRIKIYLKDTKLVIKDSGKGIKNPKKVFERFYKEQDRGIGIGLHIVKKLCDELGITISLESELDKGTTFFLNLKNIIKK